MKTKISFVPDMASPVQPYFLWSLLGVGGFRGPMFRCKGKKLKWRGTEVVVVPLPTHLYSSW